MREFNLRELNYRGGRDRLFATLPNRFEPTGAWFSNDNQILYLSVQADPPFNSRVIAIQRPGGNFNQPYDR